ncbi:MAG: patatin-like phospholipase family protein [Rhodospirillaceae bacterium]
MAKAAKTRGRATRRPGKSQPAPVNLALQGGGAHGAYTWGVLDRLLEDGRISFEGISGTSAGAMNAVVLADGLASGGADGGRAALEKFWRAVSLAGQVSPIRRSPVDVFFGNWNLDASPAYVALDLMSRLVSPYAFNPLNINPLKDLIEACVDFDRVGHCDAIKLFISATNVQTGKVKIFSGAEVTADAVMASACLPYLFQAVIIDDVPYWDGGFSGNPVLFPFHHSCTADDILLIQINPIERSSVPGTAREILDRMNEISFNSSLLLELRSIEFVDRLVAQGVLDPARYSRVRLHRIDGGDALAALQASSKLNTEMAFFLFLRDLGRDAADAWLETDADKVGRESTLPLGTVLK